MLRDPCYAFPIAGSPSHRLVDFCGLQRRLLSCTGLVLSIWELPPSVRAGLAGGSGICQHLPIPAFAADSRQQGQNAAACAAALSFYLSVAPLTVPLSAACLHHIQVTVITTSCRGVVARSLSSLLFLRPWDRREAFGALLLGVGLAADGRWGTPDDHPPAPRRPGTGRIIDVSGIMLPFAFVGKLHTLTMDRMNSSPLSGARRSVSGTILDQRRDKM